MINILISSLVKAVLNSKKRFQIFLINYAYKTIFFKSWVIFEILVILNILQRYYYDKVSLNADNYQTAGSI